MTRLLMKSPTKNNRPEFGRILLKVCGDAPGDDMSAGGKGTEADIRWDIEDCTFFCRK